MNDHQSNSNPSKAVEVSDDFLQMVFEEITHERPGAVLCVTGPLCHRAVVSQAHCKVCVSQGRSVTALKASFIGLLLQYWLILKTRNFYVLSLYLAQFIDFIGGSSNPNPNPNPMR